MGFTGHTWRCRVQAASRRSGSQSCSHLGASSSGSSAFPLSPECKSHGTLSMEALLRFSTLSDTPTSQALTSHCFPFSYEDPAALDGGEKGMDIITHILALAPRLLKDSGYGWGGSPGSLPSSHIPSCVLGLPWQSFCPHPFQPRQPQSAGASPAWLS